MKVSFRRRRQGSRFLRRRGRRQENRNPHHSQNIEVDADARGSSSSSLALDAAERTASPKSVADVAGRDRVQVDEAQAACRRSAKRTLLNLVSLWVARQREAPLASQLEDRASSLRRARRTKGDLSGRPQRCACSGSAGARAARNFVPGGILRRVKSGNGLMQGYQRPDRPARSMNMPEDPAGLECLPGRSAAVRRRSRSLDEAVAAPEMASDSSR